MQSESFRAGLCCSLRRVLPQDEGRAAAGPSPRLAANIVLSVFVKIVFVFLFLRGIMTYEGCDDEGRVTVLGKRFVI